MYRRQQSQGVPDTPSSAYAIVYETSIRELVMRLLIPPNYRSGEPLVFFKYTKNWKRKRPIGCANRCSRNFFAPIRWRILCQWKRKRLRKIVTASVNRKVFLFGRPTGKYRWKLLFQMSRLWCSLMVYLMWGLFGIFFWKLIEIWDGQERPLLQLTG